MLPILPALALAFAITASFKPAGRTLTASKECALVQVYEIREPDHGVKVLTEHGELTEAEYILTPTKMEEGVYEVEVSRKGKNIYQLEGTQYCIETRYCYEYATRDDAVLRIKSNYGYKRGVIMAITILRKYTFAIPVVKI